MGFNKDLHSVDGLLSSHWLLKDSAVYAASCVKICDLGHCAESGFPSFSFVNTVSCPQQVGIIVLRSTARFGEGRLGLPPVKYTWVMTINRHGRKQEKHCRDETHQLTFYDPSGRKMNGYWKQCTSNQPQQSTETHIYLCCRMSETTGFIEKSPS